MDYDWSSVLPEISDISYTWRSITKSRKAPKETDNGKRRLAANEGL